MQKRVPTAREHSRSPSRRCFLRASALTAAATLFAKSTLFAAPTRQAGLLAAGTGALEQTYNGLLAFVLPGRDAFSVQQGENTDEPGGVDAGVVDTLIANLDDVVPLPDFAATVAFILNNTALAVNSKSASGPFAAPFANLTFTDKAKVFAALESNPQAAPLAAALLQLAAFLAYSEAGVVDSENGELTGTPVGWTLSGYRGVSAGYAEFKGYFGDQGSSR